MDLQDSNDYDALSSKLSLARAGKKSKIHSWISSSLPQDQESTVENAEDTPTALQGDDENSGLGAPQAATGEDDPLNRQLQSSNEALRRKLLSKEAYKRYQQEAKTQPGVSKPRPRRAESKAEDDSDEETKGRSARKGNGAQTVQVAEGKSPSEGPSKSLDAAPISSSSTKKRPASYLDQLLAERGKKKKSKGKT